MLECVVNVSEGRDTAVLDELAAAGGGCLLDLHRDPVHHRSVFTMAGEDVEEATRSLARRVVELVDLRTHSGVHPRFGALDVVPFVPLGPGGVPADGTAPLDEALDARDRFARWAGEALALPCFIYGPARSLPDVRSRAFRELVPDTGPARPHPSAGACAVGARPVLVAYNVWLETPDLALAQRIAEAVRGPAVRALGLPFGAGTQVSCNLTDPATVGPGELFDDVWSQAEAAGVTVARAELVGLVPAAVLGATPRSRWTELDLDPDRTVEARLAAGRR
ncbi:MAG TPA: hypothetical protein VEI83_07140 [Acidimicrobiales bacterium]|nr:hypothetical protein [Acidimicrobiales bacterium]